MIKVTYVDHMGTDLSVVNAARVSFGNQSKWEGGSHPDFDPIRTLYPRDEKLIKYLAEHEHYSPFGHCFASFHVKAPIFVARQLVKHKFLRWNEISRRYVYGPPEFYVPEAWRGRSADKKQGSDGILEEEDFLGFSSMSDAVSSFAQEDVELYKSLILQGVAPEQARMVLPQSTMTEWYWSGSLDAFADMCNLRCKPDAQYETRLVADQISVEMGDMFPVSWAALMGGVE